jgi:hypothetical protein
MTLQLISHFMPYFALPEWSPPAGFTPHPPPTTTHHHTQKRTFVLSLNFMPCFVSDRWNSLRISPSYRRQLHYRLRNRQGTTGRSVGQHARTCPMMQTPWVDIHTCLHLLALTPPSPPPETGGGLRRQAEKLCRCVMQVGAPPTCPVEML